MPNPHLIVQMPPTASRALVMDLLATYGVPDRLTPPDGTLMPGQDPTTGGAAAEPPKDACRISAEGGLDTQGPAIRVFGNAAFAEAGPAGGGGSGSPESPRFSRLRTESTSPERQPASARRRVQFEVAEAPAADHGGAAGGAGIGAWGAAMLRGLRKSVAGYGGAAPAGEVAGGPGMSGGSHGSGAGSSSGLGSPANNRYSQTPRPWPLPDLELGTPSPGDGGAVVDDYDRRFMGVTEQARHGHLSLASRQSLTLLLSCCRSSHDPVSHVVRRIVTLE